MSASATARQAVAVERDDAARSETTPSTDQTVKSIAGTFATKVLAVSLGVPVSIILARALGPAGRGEFVAMTALAGLGMQFGNLGLHAANTYFVSRDRSLLGPLSTNSLIVSTVIGILVTAALYLVRLSGLFFGDFDLRYFGIALLWIPLGIGQLLQHNLIVGIQRFRTFNQVDAAVRVGNVVCGVALLWAGFATPTPYVLATIAVLAASYLFCLVYIHSEAAGVAPPQPRLLWAQLPYGAKTFVASLFAFLVVRSDVLLLKQLSGSYETGVYSIAVSLVDMMYVLPTAVGVVLFPSLSASPDESARWRLTRSALIHTSWILAVGAGALALGGRPIITLLFGAQFVGAYPMLVILAVAMVFYGLNNIVSVFLSASGLPPFAVWVWVAAFAVNLLLNLLWIPRYGGVGAAASSLVAYGALFILQFQYVMRRRSTGYTRVGAAS